MPSPRIEWVNHASFILASQDVQLLCDPWLVGQAFQDGWSLLSETVLDPDDFGRVTHIWISHEHPDHFNPPSLRTIRPEHRGRIVLLYQETNDRKVLKFCEGLGFRTVELKHGAWSRLGDDLEIMCYVIGPDSCLTVRARGVTLLNLNDCLPSDEDYRILRDAVGRVDLLCTQFSYAKWLGNTDEPEIREEASREKLRQMERQIRALEPRYVIPCASFMWFSHEENLYMNDRPNRIRDVYDFLIRMGRSTPIVLYPGDRWQIGAAHDSESSIERYERDAEQVGRHPLTRTKPVTLAELHTAATDFRRRVLAKVGWYEFVTERPLRVLLTDHSKALTLSVRDGLRELSTTTAPTDIQLSSDAFLYCLKFDWGFNTLHVSGRFQASGAAGYRRLARYHRLGDMLNQDRIYYESLLGRVISHSATICRSAEPRREIARLLTRLIARAVGRRSSRPATRAPRG